MSGQFIPDELSAEIDRAFQRGSRKDDPAAKISIDRFKAQIRDGQLSLSAAREILRDDGKVSILVEKTRQDIAAIENHPDLTPAPVSVPPAPIDKDLAKEILTGQAEMRAEIAELRVVITELKGATDSVVGATAELKAASEAIHTEVKKAVGALTLSAAWRTAALLLPLTLGSSVIGNEVTTRVDTGHWGWSRLAPIPMTKPPPLRDRRLTGHGDKPR